MAATASAPASASAGVALPPRPAYRETTEGQALRSAPCAGLRVDEGRSSLWRARCGENDVFVVFATRESPQRFRPSVALYRLARALGVGAVPVTVLREFSLTEVLDGAHDEAARRRLGEELAVKANGAVSAAVLLAPQGVKQRATQWSHEQALWSKLAEASEPPPADSREAVEGYVTMLALDYLSANIFRRSVEQDERGRLWMVANHDAFTEHPESFAVDQIFGKLKRCGRFPKNLVAGLEQLDEARLDAILRAGPYEDWLVHHRALIEASVRLRALRSLLHVRREERGDALLLPQ